jgi:hypothetical protein
VPGHVRIHYVGLPSQAHRICNLNAQMVQLAQLLLAAVVLCIFECASCLPAKPPEVLRLQLDDADNYPDGIDNLYPRLIPRVLHQTLPSLDSISPKVAKLQNTWLRFNPGWELWLWDDAAIDIFVSSAFPAYLKAYHGLPKNVERADFFRYLVVLRYGGAYADTDTECVRPLDEVIGATDALVVGWEDEWSSMEDLVKFRFSRFRQVRSHQLLIRL